MLSRNELAIDDDVGVPIGKGVDMGAGHRIPVFVDGGFRRGADVARAIALGAKAVLVGRPYVYGLAVGGEEGVAAVLEIARAVCAGLEAAHVLARQSQQIESVARESQNAP